MTFTGNTWPSDGVAVDGTHPSENTGCDIALLNHVNAAYKTFFGEKPNSGLR